MTNSELLHKFFANRCSAEEAERALRLLEEHPELLEEKLPPAEWDNPKFTSPISAQLKDEMWKNIDPRPAKPVFRIISRALAAAAILTGLYLGFNYFNTSSAPDPQVAATVQQNTSIPFMAVTNNGTSIQLIRLEDNSVVRLYPGSKIAYPQAFIRNRQIHLTGKAEFDVMKNAASPFVVYSGAVSTTAIGTRFLVDDTDASRIVNVQLYEGKVLVRPVDSSLLMTEALLEAGQQCFVNIASRQIRVNQLYLAQKSVPQLLNPVKEVALPVEVKVQQTTLEFKKAPLQEVLHNLEHRFAVPIEFTPGDVEQNFFTGSFSEYDSLHAILDVIAMMNELEFSKGEERIKVRKVARKPIFEQKSPVHQQDAEKSQLMYRLGLEKIIPRSFAISNSMPVRAPMIVEGDNGTTFHTITLPRLFDELQQQTPRKIIFDRDAIQHIRFTGKLVAGESVKNNLRLICEISGLNLIVKRGEFIIEQQSKKTVTK